MNVLSGRLILATSLFGVVLLSGLAGGWAESPRLTVVQDESSMERIIASCLTAKHELSVEEKKVEDDESDLFLSVPFTGDPMPGYSITIDTESLNTADDGTIVERGVMLDVFTRVKVPEDRRSGVLNVINDFHRGMTFCQFYIDTDGEIVCSWALNVMAEGLDPEYVYDAVVRLSKNWIDIYPRIQAALKE